MLAVIRLTYIKTLLYALSAISLSLIILQIASRLRLTEIMQRRCDTTDDEAEIMENDAVLIIRKQNRNDKASEKKLKKQINILTYAAMVFILLTMADAGIFLYYTNIAVKHGSYDHIELGQTLADIHEYSEKGFIESELPDDLTGKIIIYFKYGCDDCKGIHDSLMQYISDNSLTDIYFVSSRSKAGKKLLEKYPVAEVPSAIYIRQKESTVSDMFMEKLYVKSDSDEIQFRQEGLDILIERMQNGD
jgi:hypothetical protein